MLKKDCHKDNYKDYHKEYYIGVDGGATKSVVRIEDKEGHLIGEMVSGPANIRISVSQAWQSISSAITTLLPTVHLSEYPHQEDHDHHFCLHAGMGLAGCEVKEAYQSFMQYAKFFATFIVSFDSHVACLGAHQADDGAIIIAGTGVAGYQIEKGHSVKVGGWGFPHDDEGGGAWLGLKAINLTCQYLDRRLNRRLASSGLAQAVLSHFGDDQELLVKWANQANASQFAELAPLVIQQHQQHDLAATHILKQAAKSLDAVALALKKGQIDQSVILPCSLVGGLSPHLAPLLSPSLRERLRPQRQSPEQGAILLVRDAVHQRQTAM